VALGADGIRAHLAPEAVYVEASTVPPSLTDELAKAFADFVAMPVLGSPSQVASGKAIYLVGADDEHAQGVLPLLPALSENYVRFERPSLASVAKLTVNPLLLNGVVSLAEAFANGRAAGDRGGGGKRHRAPSDRHGSRPVRRGSVALGDRGHRVGDDALPPALALSPARQHASTPARQHASPEEGTKLPRLAPEPFWRHVRGSVEVR